MEGIIHLCPHTQPLDAELLSWAAMDTSSILSWWGESHRVGAHDPTQKCHHKWESTGRDRTGGRHNEEAVGGRVDTQHQRQREKFLNPCPRHTETKVGGRLCMVIFLAGVGVCVSLPAFVHLPKVTLTGCEVLPRLMRDQ